MAYKATDESVIKLRGKTEIHDGEDGKPESWVSYLDFWSTIYAIGLEKPPSIEELCQMQQSSGITSSPASPVRKHQGKAAVAENVLNAMVAPVPVTVDMKLKSSTELQVYCVDIFPFISLSF